ncbi:DUF3110 domain-containing protein [Nodularia spumigena]|uniref:DUF3110 domain-containing protein n=3 Tax=Cyanophyceae TaxID=3028117 RepID=A0A161V9D2_NODSP|nr:DUF3110 domain-containing protein [Nodularia spumigena]KZL47726.1 hypothetical protein A2T98_21800 [Nodularia spumigena CENA596]MDB9306389.1 DUF3110 domain-containing protein [Nodularia spumigena CS-591/12]MDB9319444.1 DUF3110 domain-containing protein [Nodularia spumigena CS-590/01A]MDB9328788.1 DUF3110 domain-containing protein [Nodularia spumigena CS-590/02]MDB9334104.1 DUF3110 domain-containing protein [Nodularia spumigena CS-590/01]
MITPMRVFVLIFNAHTENEGIHSIRVGDAAASQSGTVRNKILMFESEDDALRFALLLEAQDFPTPTVEMLDAEEIKEFCESAGYEWEIVPANSDLILPPEMNLENTDWQADEQEDTDEDSYLSNQVPPAAPEMSDSELENMRRKLEGLL